MFCGRFSIYSNSKKKCIFFGRRQTEELRQRVYLADFELGVIIQLFLKRILTNPKHLGHLAESVARISDALAQFSSVRQVSSLLSCAVDF